MQIANWIALIAGPVLALVGLFLIKNRAKVASWQADTQKAFLGRQGKRAAVHSTPKRMGSVGFIFILGGIAFVLTGIFRQ
ncbi:hypothetical protein [Subtercola vilae]|uniref:hypothetical protein n=1 Tax=Subtercola vilae TaxID=2056433 RepID=UPI0010AB1EB0|nr:hypothetical protein [Subtercola vilae]